MQKKIKIIQVAAFVAMIALNVITNTCLKILREEISE